MPLETGGSPDFKKAVESVETSSVDGGSIIVKHSEDIEDYVKPSLAVVTSDNIDNPNTYNETERTGTDYHSGWTKPERQIMKLLAGNPLIGSTITEITARLKRVGTVNSLYYVGVWDSDGVMKTEVGKPYPH